MALSTVSSVKPSDSSGREIKGGELLTLTGLIVECRKEHFEELLNTVSEEVKKLFSGKVPVAVESCIEILKPPDIVGLS